MTTPDPLLGQSLHGRYRVESLLGQGKMARVYAAEQLSMGRTIALKVLRPELHAQAGAKARFRQEVAAVTRLQSPHTIEFYDYGETPDGNLFIAMEFLDGETLADRLTRERIIPPAEVISIVRQIAGSLEEAHSAGIIHRDLKPANIHFPSQPSPLQPFTKVLDFGLAKIVDTKRSAAITQQTMTVGTPAYLAPELAKVGGEADGRSDIYALGVIIFEMLCGQRPFDADSPMEMLLTHINQPIPSIRDRIGGLPETIDDFFATALAKDPMDRFESPTALSSALGRSLGDRRRG